MAVTTRHKKALKNIGKYRTEKDALVKAQYSESYALSGHIKETKGWQELSAKHLSDKKLTKAHEELLNQKEIEYFVFPKSMDDEEIKVHLEANGLECINVRSSEKGKLAFYSIPNANAKKAALDMAYKVRGLYAPEKHINANMEVEASPEIKELASKLNEIYGGTGVRGDGALPGAMGDKA